MDFTIPDGLFGAPLPRQSGAVVVPLAVLAKGALRAFDIVDETGASIPIATSLEASMIWSRLLPEVASRYLKPEAPSPLLSALLRRLVCAFPEEKTAPRAERLRIALAHARNQPVPDGESEETRFSREVTSLGQALDRSRPPALPWELLMSWWSEYEFEAIKHRGPSVLTAADAEHTRRQLRRLEAIDDFAALAAMLTSGFVVLAHVHPTRTASRRIVKLRLEKEVLDPVAFAPLRRQLVAARLITPEFLALIVRSRVGRTRHVLAFAYVSLLWANTLRTAGGGLVQGALGRLRDVLPWALGHRTRLLLEGAAGASASYHVEIRCPEDLFLEDAQLLIDGREITIHDWIANRRQEAGTEAIVSPAVQMVDEGLPGRVAHLHVTGVARSQTLSVQLTFRPDPSGMLRAISSLGLLISFFLVGGAWLHGHGATVAGDATTTLAAIPGLLVVVMLRPGEHHLVRALVLPLRAVGVALAAISFAAAGLLAVHFATGSRALILDVLAACAAVLTCYANLAWVAMQRRLVRRRHVVV